MKTHALHQINNCLIFAHRGACQDAIENTQPAFDAALAYAVDGIETDVQLTRDEITVLWHDHFLDKIGLANKRIDDFNYAQLKSFSFPKSKNECIMSLQGFLDAYRKHCCLLIEIKNREWEPISRHEIKIRQTLNLIGPTYEQHIIISSFNLASLIYANQCKPKFPIIYNFKTEQTVVDAQQTLTIHPFLYGLCLPIEILDHAMINLLRDQDKCIAVYTCNTDEEINKALKFGVDILISDYPRKALKMRDT
mgnify:CR=1 FL=1|tara:strand:+ start:3112 stop:3864 length:753 start_codon:yes stop_codon:yes gene_type:complete